MTSANDIGSIASLAIGTDGFALISYYDSTGAQMACR